MGRIRLLAAGLGALVLALACAGTAAAQNEPECFESEIRARPGLERTHEVHCHRADGVTVATQPSKGELSEPQLSGVSVRFRYRPTIETDARTTDEFALRLSGPNGTTTHAVTATILPASENTAPKCRPVQAARRTTGSAPVEVSFMLDCWDPEGDAFDVSGTGPGVHLTAPAHKLSQWPGSSSIAWTYRTATANGTESTSVHAVDDLGARSADVPISVQVGPDVNRSPECVDYDVSTRLGAIRRFGISCTDADNDAIGARIGQGTEGGRLTVQPGHTESEQSFGSAIWLDARYEPFPSQPARDPFTVIASDGRATIETARAMVVREQAYQGGMSCGAHGLDARTDEPYVITVHCLDDVGDPLLATVTRAPVHGVAGPPVASERPYGWLKWELLYEPAPGYAGYDALEVTLSHGDKSLVLEISIAVTRVPESWTTPWSDPGPPAPSLPPTGQLSVGQPPPIRPVDQARAALRTRAVTQLARVGDARVYAARKGARRRVAVTCDIACRIDARFRVPGARAAAVRRKRARGAPGRATLLSLPRAKRTLTMDLTIRAEGRRTARRVIRVRTRGA